MPTKCKPRTYLRDRGDRRQRWMWDCPCGRSNEVAWFATESAAKGDARKRVR